jgi:hypothetical protein
MSAAIAAKSLEIYDKSKGIQSFVTILNSSVSTVGLSIGFALVNIVIALVIYVIIKNYIAMDAGFGTYVAIYVVTLIIGVSAIAIANYYWTSTIRGIGRQLLATVLPAK